MASKKHRFTTPQIVVLIVIVLSMVAVIAAAICTVFLKPENTVKDKISELSADYYENYLYEKFDFSNLSPEDYLDFMQKYEKTGLTATTLRQLLLYDHQKNAEFAPLLKKYCDEDTTYIKYYPEHPYSKTSYRVEYTYSCEF
ncbi:hypothetical protein IKE13_00305 [Candidatus Saccharibacteria bacterium]|nr:hypothetical protein [Candidatus Saccharibacteria bacterium]